MHSDLGTAGAMLMEACLWLVALNRRANGTPECPGDQRVSWDCGLYDSETCTCPVAELPRAWAGPPFDGTLGGNRPTVRDIGYAWCWWRYFAGLYFGGKDLEQMERSIEQEMKLLAPALEGNTAGEAGRGEETGGSVQLPATA